MKEASEVIREFDELVNMTSNELEKWLKSDDSLSAGWPKETEEGETVGHDSGRKIVEILKDNPDKDAEKYTEDHISHMRRVVAYCKRHLAQEEAGNNSKSDEEVAKTKSYASLKNWGHDPLKKRHGEEATSGQSDAKGESGAEKAGDKRKKDEQDTSAPSKKRETDKGESKATNGGAAEATDKTQADEAEAEEEANGDDAKEEGAKAKESDQASTKENGGGDSTAQAAKGPEPGDTVSWNWGSGQPEGKVLDVKPEKTTITTKKGNEVTRDGDPEDPAVVIDTGKSKAIKLNHELNEIDPSIRLRRAIHTNDTLLVTRILRSHPPLLHNPDTSDAGLSNSSLHLAASLGHRDICAALLAAGHERPCAALNEHHQTALMLAAAAGRTDAVHLLCEADRPGILRRDARGRDAVMHASMGGHDTALQLLLTYVPCGPAEAVTRADLDGNTALHFASANGHLLAVRTLLAAGADVECRNVWNWTPAAYSATVQAEVYLKGLVSEVEKRQQLRKEVETAKKGGAVRVVAAESSDEDA